MTRTRARYTKTRHQGIYYRDLESGARRYSVAISDQGRTNWITVTGGERDAIAKRAELLAARGRGEKIAPSRIVFADFASAWLADEKHRLAETTYTGYERAVRAELIPAFGRLRLNAVTADRIARFIKERQDAGKAPNTIRTFLVPLSRILNRAVRKGHIASNPIATLEPSERPGSAKRSRRVLTRDEVGTLLTHTRARYRTLVATAIWTGLRQAELLGLVWGDVDFDERIIRVRMQLSRKTMTRRSLKTVESERDVVLAPGIVKALREHKLQTATSGPNDYVFATASGRPYGWSNIIRAALHHALRGAGLHDPQPTWHDFRHTFASLLIAEGADPVTVQRQVGHSSPDITLRIYSHEFEQARHGERVRSMLDDALAGAMPVGEVEPGQVVSLG